MKVSVRMKDRSLRVFEATSIEFDRLYERLLVFRTCPERKGHAAGDAAEVDMRYIDTMQVSA